MCCHFLLQGIFLTQGRTWVSCIAGRLFTSELLGNPKLLRHVWHFVIPWSPRGSSVHGILQARILEWAAFPFSRGSPQPRNRTPVSYIAGRFFTNWAVRESPKISLVPSLRKWNQSMNEFLLCLLPSLVPSNAYFGLPRWLSGKRICLPMQETQEMEVRSLSREDPWRRT